MTLSERIAKTRRDAIYAARRLADASTLLGDYLEHDANYTPPCSSVLGSSAVEDVLVLCAELRLLNELSREGR